MTTFHAESPVGAASLKSCRAATLYLLDGACRVINVRPATPKASVLSRNERFFKHYALHYDDAALLFRVLRSRGEQMLILASRKGPLLINTAFFGRTGLFLVAVPSGRIASLLCSASDYADALQASDLFVSKTLCDRHYAPTAQRYQAVAAWIRSFQISLFAGLRAHMTAQTSLTGIAHGLAEIAALCGCILECDSGELASRRSFEVDPFLLPGSAFEVLMVAYHTAIRRRVQLRVVNDPGSVPMLELSFCARRDAPDPLLLVRNAMQEDGVLLPYRDTADPRRICMLLALGGKELSIQEVKAESIYVMNERAADRVSPFSC